MIRGVYLYLAAAALYYVCPAAPARAFPTPADGLVVSAQAGKTAITSGAGDFKTKWPSHKIVRLSASDVGPNAGVFWRVKPLTQTDPPVEIDWATPKDVKDIGFVAPPGKYDVLLSTVEIKDGKPSISIDEKTIEIEGQWSPSPAPGGFSAFDKIIRGALRDDPDKGLAVKLANVYAGGARSAAAAPTWGALFRGMESAADAAGVKGKLPRAQDAIEMLLKAELPWKGAVEQPIAPTDAAKAAALFTEIAAALTK